MTDWVRRVCLDQSCKLRKTKFGTNASDHDRILREVKKIKWEKQVRSYVTGHGACAGVTSGQRGPEVFKQPAAIAEVTKQVNQILRQWCKDNKLEHFGWTSLQINVNTESDWHYDHRNVGPSLIAILGNHVGGELEIKGSSPAKFDN